MADLHHFFLPPFINLPCAKTVIHTVTLNLTRCSSNGAKHN